MRRQALQPTCENLLPNKPKAGKKLSSQTAPRNNITEPPNPSSESSDNITSYSTKYNTSTSVSESQGSSDQLQFNPADPPLNSSESHESQQPVPTVTWDQPPMMPPPTLLPVKEERVDSPFGDWPPVEPIMAMPLIKDEFLQNIQTGTGYLFEAQPYNFDQYEPEKASQQEALLPIKPDPYLEQLKAIQETQETKTLPPQTPSSSGLRKRTRRKAFKDNESDNEKDDPDYVPHPKAKRRKQATPKKQTITPKKEPKVENNAHTENDSQTPSQTTKSAKSSQSKDIKPSVAESFGIYQTFSNGEGVEILQRDDYEGALFLGNHVVARNKDWLLSNEVALIVNVTSEVKNHFPDYFKYEKVPISDATDIDIMSYLYSISKLVHTTRTAGNAGQSRSVTFIASYLMLYCNYSLKRCMDLFKEKEVETKINDGFCRQLMQLERETFKITTNSVDLQILPARSRKPPERLHQTTIIELWWKQYWKRNTKKREKTPQKPKQKRKKLVPLPPNQPTLEQLISTSPSQSPT